MKEGEIEKLWDNGDNDDEEFVKEIKVQQTKRGQHFLQLPIAFVELLKIKKGDRFIVKVPKDIKDYSIKLKRKLK